MTTTASSDGRLEWAFRQCRAAGMRRTRALTEILNVLASVDRPLSLQELAEKESLGDLCDQATLYRQVSRLEMNGVVRRLGLHQRAAYFVLRHPGHHDDYLVCTKCGAIDALDMHCPVEALEEKVSQMSGFDGIYHELEFFGICPSCVD